MVDKLQCSPHAKSSVTASLEDKHLIKKPDDYARNEIVSRIIKRLRQDFTFCRYNMFSKYAFDFSK